MNNKTQSDVIPWAIASKHHVDELLALIECGATILPNDIEDRINFSGYSDEAPPKLKIAYGLLAETIPSKEFRRELIVFSNILDDFVRELKNTTSKPKGIK